MYGSRVAVVAVSAVFLGACLNFEGAININAPTEGDEPVSFSVQAEPAIDEVALTWSSTGISPASYLIEYHPIDGPVQSAVAPSAAQGHNITGLTKRTDYDITVTPRDGADNPINVPNNQVSTTTLGLLVEIASISTGHAGLQWTLAPGEPTPDFYDIEFTPQGGSSSTTNTFIASSGHTVIGLSSNTNYTFIVRPVYGSSRPFESNAAQVTTHVSFSGDVDSASGCGQCHTSTKYHDETAYNNYVSANGNDDGFLDCVTGSGTQDCSNTGAMAWEDDHAMREMIRRWLVQGPSFSN